VPIQSYIMRDDTSCKLAPADEEKVLLAAHCVAVPENLEYRVCDDVEQID